MDKASKEAEKKQKEEEKKKQEEEKKRKEEEKKQAAAAKDDKNKDAKKKDDRAKDAKKKDDKKKDEKEKDPPLLTFTMSQNSDAESRTPAEQAAQVAAGRSWVCWGAHMTDSARHVVMKADGKYTDNPKKVLGEDFDEFKKQWAAAMKSNGLKNANGGDGWYEGDGFHLEMPESKMKKTDERAAACLEEYVKLTRKDGKPQNKKFEDKYAKDLEKYIKKYEKKDEDEDEDDDD
jgi:hypothetical protein